MKLHIRDSRTIADVQKEFSKEFPYLKLEFFDAIHQDNKPTPKSRMYGHDKKLSACRKKHTDGEVEIAPAFTVSQLETELWNNFGLSVQVFRKSGTLWIETSLTDSWSLKRQNEEGQEFSNGDYQQKEDLDLSDRDKWA
jgi:hypothetical protein